MGEAIPRQQPAVVLRSRFKHLRALVAPALIAVAGLTVAVVILASDSSQVAGPSNPSPSGIRYGGMNPGTARPESAPLPQAEHSPKNRIDGTRYDGDWGVASAPPPSAGSATEMKDEASTAAAIGHPGSETEFRGSKASADGTSRFARPGSETEFRGSKASEDGTSRFARPGSETDLPGPASALP